MPLTCARVTRSERSRIAANACVAFIINVTDPAVAHEMLEKLPPGKAHMMSFELIPIGPLNPLRFLQGMQPKP